MREDVLLVQYGEGEVFCLVRPLTWTDEDGNYTVGSMVFLDPGELRDKRVWIRSGDGELWLLNGETVE